jgi:hypothetical protein
MTTDRRVVARIASAYYSYKTTAKSSALSSREWVAAGMPFAEAPAKKAAAQRPKSPGRPLGKRRRTFMNATGWGPDDDEDGGNINDDASFSAEEDEESEFFEGRARNKPKRKMPDTAGDAEGATATKKSKTDEGQSTEKATTDAPTDAMQGVDSLANSEIEMREEDSESDEADEDMQLSSSQQGDDEGGERKGRKKRVKRKGGDLSWSIRSEPALYPRRKSPYMHARSRSGRVIRLGSPL